VGEESFKEICIRTGLTGDREAHLLVVDRDGTAKACTQRTYPLSLALQMAWAFPLPAYVGEGGTLLAQATEAAMRKAQRVAAEQEVYGPTGLRPSQRAGPFMLSGRGMPELSSKRG